MQVDVWYKLSEFEDIVPVKKTQIKELLKGLIREGKIESAGNTKAKKYKKKNE